MSTRSYLITIPVEILEYVLTLLAGDGEPRAIAELAATCHLLHNVVYKSSDSHLWREVYLTTFDDPRPARRIIYGEDVPFDWGGEYRRRIWTEGYMRSLPVDSEHAPKVKLRGTQMIGCSYESGDLAQHTAEANIRAVEAILSALDTAATLPPAPDLLSSQSRSLGSLSRLLSYDVTPVVVVDTTTTAVDTASSDFERGADAEAEYTAHPSRNIGWVRALFGTRLPRAWAARFAYALDPVWEGAREGQAMYRLLCATGWIPRPQSQYASMGTADVEALAAMGAGEVERWRDERVERGDARDNARRRVYNMRYPRAARGWGPFMPYCEESPYAFGVDALLDELDEEMDGEDGSWDGGEDEEDEEDEDKQVEEQVCVSRKRMSAAFRIPSALLRPDWAFLASVRIVIEANMRENGWEGLNGISEWDALRIGRWPPAAESDVEVPKVPKRDRGRKPTADSVEGWDWAGVEGVWRRCICWLDYRDLYDQNHDSKFSNMNGLEEVAIIVPFRLYITKYTRSPLSTTGHPNRPTIHVEGHAFTGSPIHLDPETAGAAWEPDKDTRASWGTISTCADGSIRWCMYSSTEDDRDEAEWISEGVQVGPIGSGTGVVGMWTGVKHLIDDPIGAWWQWRVA